MNLSSFSAIFTDFFAVNTLPRLLFGLVILLFCILVSTLVRRRCIDWLEIASHRARGGTVASLALRALRSVPVFAYVVVSVYLPIDVLTLPPRLDRFLASFFFVFVVMLGAWILARVAESFLDRTIARSGLPRSRSHSTIAVMAARVVFAGLALLIVLDHLGVNIAPILASMGVLSVFAGLGMQSALSDFFATISLYSDAPFEVGDTIMIGTETGTVLRIGTRSTSIRSVHGPEVVIANKDLVTSRVTNISRADYRRIALLVAIHGDLTSEKIQSVTTLLSEVCHSIKHAKPDTVHIRTYTPTATHWEVAIRAEVSKGRTIHEMSDMLTAGILDACRRVEVEIESIGPVA